MKQTIKTDSYTVYDDFLPPELFEAMREHCWCLTYEHVHAAGVQRVWNMDDGLPMRGKRRLMVGTERQGDKVKAAQVSGPYDELYPEGSPVDEFAERIIDVSNDLAGIIGEAGKDWDMLTSRAYHYPMNTGLDWHNDSHRYRGSFVYYMMPEWRASWGGELLLSEVRGIDRETQESIDGTFIGARPNRLAVVSGHMTHKVAKVRAAAGNHLRESYTGFFVDPEYSKSILRKLDP